MVESILSDVSHNGPQAPLQEDSSSAVASKEFEALYQSVQQQLKQCQEEQTLLRSRLESVVEENNSLSEQLQAELRKTSSPPAVFVKSLNNNMKQQLDAAFQERDSAVEMWQMALRLVSALETELKDYRDNSHLTSALEKVQEVRAEYSRAISLLEDKLAAATSRLAKDKAAREAAQERNEQLENDLKLLTERYEKRCADVDEALLGRETALKQVSDLEKLHLDALEDAKEAKLACSELEAALERSLSRLEETLTKEAEAREKVDEALNIVDFALLERDAALQKATEATEDAQQLRKSINELIAEAGCEVQAEAEQIKEQYNNRIKSVLLDMRRLHVENKSKSTQIQKLRSDLSSTEGELQRTKRELDIAVRDRPSFSALDRKLEGYFRTQELVGGESIRADLEIEQLRAEILKLIQSNELEQRQFLLERHVLEQQMNALQADLEDSSKTVSELSAKINNLASTVRQKDNEIISLKKALAYLSHQHSLDKSGLDSNVLEQLKVWEEENKVYQELQNQLDSQRALTNKWKTEVNLITSRFQSRLKELHSEALSLRRENREMRNQLQAARCQLNDPSHIVDTVLPVASMFSTSW